MKNQIKAVFSLAIFVVLSACGSDNETSIDLSPFKGLDTEPALTADTIADGDPLYLNYEYTGSMMDTNTVDDSVHSFTFSPVETSLVVMNLISTSEEADLRVYVDGDEGGLNLISIGGGNDILVLEAKAGITYSVEASVYLEDVDVLYSYSLVVAEANRETLRLEENEYWIGVDIDQSEICESTDLEEAGVFKESFSLGVVFNGVDLYLGSRDNKFYLTKTSNNSYEHRSVETDDDEGSSFSSELVYYLQVNENSGGIIVDAEYKNIEIYSETTTCNGTQSWAGNVLL